MPDRQPATERIPRLQVKICGLQDPGQAAAIAALGADAIGVVAVPGSPRFLPADQRPALFAAARGARPDCQGVLVVADPQETALSDLLPSKGHRVLQLHGTETPERCRELRRALGSEMALWKALRIRSREDLHRSEEYWDVVDALLLDAWVPDQLGGTGRQIPIHLLDNFQPPLPWWLAGGIRPETLEAVLGSVTPTGLDASSGVEDRPGWKNLERVRWLLAGVKQSEKPLDQPAKRGSL